MALGQDGNTYGGVGAFGIMVASRLDMVHLTGGGTGMDAKGFGGVLRVRHSYYVDS